MSSRQTMGSASSWIHGARDGECEVELARAVRSGIVGWALNFLGSRFNFLGPSTCCDWDVLGVAVVIFDWKWVCCP
jgi:hypothetical protein